MCSAARNHNGNENMNKVLCLAVVLSVILALTLLRRHEDSVVFAKMQKEEVFSERYTMRNGKWFDMYCCPETLPRYFWDVGLYVIDSDGNKHKLVCNFYSPYKFRASLQKGITDYQYAGPYDSFEDFKKHPSPLYSFARCVSPNILLVFDVCLVLSIAGIGVYCSGVRKRKEKKGAGTS